MTPTVEPRVVSFLPAATEMACALGLGSRVVGISHECDFPAEIRDRPVVSRNALPIETMSPAEIDAAVAERIRRGQSLYVIDEELLARLAPTHILAQSLCEVCAPSGNEITIAIRSLPLIPELLCFTPHLLDDVHTDLLELGRATGRAAAAESLVASSRARIRAAADRAAGAGRRPRVLFLEWTEPCFSAGHWVPEMIELAGGHDALGRHGADSRRLSFEEIAAWDPEVVVVSPCGFRLDRSTQLMRALLERPAWSDLAATKAGRVFAVDANAYFARPGPRVAEGVELLAHLIHPERCAWTGPRDAFVRAA